MTMALLLTTFGFQTGNVNINVNIQNPVVEYCETYVAIAEEKCIFFGYTAMEIQEKNNLHEIGFINNNPL